MAAKEPWDYLSEVTPDYNGTLDINRHASIQEEGDKNQVVHVGDDSSIETISFSDDSIFTVSLPLDKLKESESGTILDFYFDSTKANARARSFKWIHYGEHTDRHTYTVQFLSKITRDLSNGQIHGIKDIKLLILGRAPA